MIVLSNNADGRAPELAFALAGTLFGEDVRLPAEEKTFSLDPGILDRYMGVYEMGPDANPRVARKLTIVSENGPLMVMSGDGSKFEGALNDRLFSLLVATNHSDVKAVVRGGDP